MSFRKAIPKNFMRLGMVMMTILVVTSMQLLFAAPAKGDPLDKVEINLGLNNETLIQAFQKIESKSSFYFMYRNEEVKNIRGLVIKSSIHSVEWFLKTILANTSLTYRQLNNQILIMTVKKDSQNPTTLLIPRQTKLPYISVANIVTGQVTNTKKEPLVGVSIIVKGAATGTFTDTKGNYSIDVPENGNLIFSYVGFARSEIPVNGRSAVDVVLEESVSELDQVVVIGYGTQRKADLTGAVSVVDVGTMNRQPSAQITEQLQGQASGVTVRNSGQPGEAPQVRIRGINTFGNSSPLYVVDGIPIEDISNLNPNDIANMQVLKDAGSASIYGARAANGVIIISTKKGAGNPSIKYNGYYGIQSPPKGNVYDILSPREQADLTWLALKNTNPNVPINDRQYGAGTQPVLPYYILPAGAAQGGVDESTYFVTPFYTDPNAVSTFNQIIRANQEGTNWFQEVFSPAPIQSHDISISQGGEKGNFLLSLNSFNQEGTMKHIFLEKYTARVNSQYNISKNFQVGQNFNYSVSNGNMMPQQNPILHTYRMPSIVPVYDIAENFAGTRAPQMGSGINPVAILERNKNNRTRTNRLFGNVFASIDLFDVLTFKTNFGGNSYNTNGRDFSSPTYENQANEITVSQLTERAYEGYNWTWSNTVQFKENFNDLHDLTILLGSEAYHNQDKRIQAVAQRFYSADPNYVNLSTGSGTQTNSGFYTEDALFSLFGRGDYTYKDRYIFSATLRRDATSRFTNPRYGWFPAFSAGWRISQEKIMFGIDWISDLKLRGSYGVMGNQSNVSPANAFTTYSSNRSRSYYDIMGSNNTTTEGFQKSHIGNPNAQWEKNINYNIGVDASLFNNRLQFTVDYYRKDVKDLLFNPELPGTAGAATVPYINIAEIKNNGLDLSATAFINASKDLKMKATLNFTTYNNRIVNISDGANYFDQQVSRNGLVRNAINHSMSQFYGYKIEGFWNSQAEVDKANSGAKSVMGNPNAVYQTDIKVGRFRYADINNDGIISANDRTFIGNPNPDFSAGLNLGFDYKNFDLNIFLYGVYGNEILNNVKWWTDFYGTFAGAKSSTALYDSWTPNNHNAKAPIQETASSFSTANESNSYFIEDGSYLRLKNIQLGYNLANKLIEKYKIQRFRVYIQAADLLTITHYSGVDPELTGSATAFGIDGGAYPYSNKILLGMSLGF